MNNQKSDQEKGGISARLDTTYRMHQVGSSGFSYDYQTYHKHISQVLIATHYFRYVGDICNPYRTQSVRHITGFDTSIFAVIFSLYRESAVKRHTTTSCVKNQSEIYCRVPSVLLIMKRFKYHASMVELRVRCLLMQLKKAKLESTVAYVRDRVEMK